MNGVETKVAAEKSELIAAIDQVGKNLKVLYDHVMSLKKQLSPLCRGTPQSKAELKDPRPPNPVTVLHTLEEHDQRVCDLIEIVQDIKDSLVL